MSLRWVRSPEAPKIVRAHGSAVRRSRSPSRRGFGSATFNRLHRVTPELVAESGVDLRRERLVLPRPEPREQRERDHAGRNAFVDRLEDRPAALAGVLDVAADVPELRILLEGA